jgi:hypothetical protein
LGARVAVIDEIAATIYLLAVIYLNGLDWLSIFNVYLKIGHSNVLRQGDIHRMMAFNRFLLFGLVAACHGDIIDCDETAHPHKEVVVAIHHNLRYMVGIVTIVTIRKGGHPWKV